MYEAGKHKFHMSLHVHKLSHVDVICFTSVFETKYLKKVSGEKVVEFMMFDISVI